MYLTNDDNSSTFVKHPLHKQQQQEQQQQQQNQQTEPHINVGEMTTPMKFHSPEESTMGSTANSTTNSSSSSSSSNQDEHPTKPCHWVDDEASVEVMEDLSIEIDVDEEDMSTLNSSFHTTLSCEELSVALSSPPSPQLLEPCCEPGAIEVTVAWNSFQKMVTYVTPTTSSTITCTTKQRRRRSKHRGKLLPACPANSPTTMVSRKSVVRTLEPAGVRSADI